MFCAQEGVRVELVKKEAGLVWGRLGRGVEPREGVELRQTQEARFREYILGQEAERQRGKGEREREGVALTMARDEGRREDMERRKRETLSQVSH